MQKTIGAARARGVLVALIGALLLVAGQGTAEAQSEPQGTRAEAGLIAAGAGYSSPHGSVRVRALQRRLLRAGASPGPVDGLFGPLTEAAVRRFQRHHGLVVDGLVGDATWGALARRFTALAAERRRDRASHSPERSSLLARGSGYGERGGSERVRGLQRSLLELGFQPGPVDGLFGPRTEAAVIAFQGAHSLVTDGIVGHRTRAQLAAAESREPRADRRVERRSTPKGTRVSRPPALDRPLGGPLGRAPAGGEPASIERPEFAKAFLYVIVAIALLSLLGAGVVEQRRHRARLDGIPVRVLVNGVRGKSSITRLSAGALRGGGLRVVAKTTGATARIIWPDASETPVNRKFDAANIGEEIAIVRRTALERPRVLVIECMAVQPDLQEFDQTKLVSSTVGVLSNVRDDHLEEMGPTLDDVARSLSRSMPEGGVCITAESERFRILEEEAAKRRCRLIRADPASVSDAEIQSFAHFTFKENVAIALAVAEQLGVSRRDALRGMWEAAPDPGGLGVERYRVDGKVLRVANLLAANDPSSTVMNFEQLLEMEEISPPIFTLISCRPDRVVRNRQMGTIVPQLRTEKLFVIGHPSRSATAALPEAFDGSVTDLGGDNRDPDEIFNRIMEEVDTETSLVAIGNIRGQGERLLEYLQALGERR